MPGDVYFGDPEKPLPDWRKEAPAQESDDDKPLTDAEREVLIGLAASEVKGAASGAWSVTAKSLCILRTEAATAGLRGDLVECRTVHLADRRWLYQHVPIDQGFNVRSVPGGDYFTSTTNSGTAW